MDEATARAVFKLMDDLNLDLFGERLPLDCLEVSSLGGWTEGFSLKLGGDTRLAVAFLDDGLSDKLLVSSSKGGFCVVPADAEPIVIFDAMMNV